MEALAVLIFPSKMPFSPSLSRIALFSNSSIYLDQTEGEKMQKRGFSGAWWRSQQQGYDFEESLTTPSKI
jgi:hypothetical protein